jgi:hypothetical protein
MKSFSQNKKMINQPDLFKKEVNMKNFWKSFWKMFEKIYDYKIGNFPIAVLFAPFIFLIVIFMPVFVIVWWGPMILLAGILQFSSNNFYIGVPRFIFWGWTIFISYIFWGEILKSIMKLFEEIHLSLF